ncbi:DUF6270 domain-containing protein [Arthrobacter koreensis]|uniref:DUF6270 domain-containing protein n=1 Tax=Arthrobacter koreensis TaxID=199136 RepID=UPI0036DD16AB
MPSRRVFVYGGNAAANLINIYSEGAVRAGYVVRQSLISAMYGPSGVALTLPENLSEAAARHVNDDALSALPSKLKDQATTLDCVLWDLTDERFGVHALSDGTFLTSSPQLQAASLKGASLSRRIPFGTREHFLLWREAADQFVDLLVSLDLFSKALVLQVPWAEVDEAGQKVDFPFGQPSKKANANFKPYYRHLRRRGMRLIKVVKPVASSSHPLGRSPLNIRDACYHDLASRLTKAMATLPTTPEAESWNWDDQHRTPVILWTDPEQLDVRAAGRTQHRIAPRRALNEEFPARLLIQNTGSDTLLVVSHGALPRKKYSVPRFEFLSTLENRAENLLFLADGALENHNELELAWFTGSRDDDLTARYTSIVRSAADQLGAKKILFIGGSGGGFASLQLAASVEGSRALVFNPQTSIRRYWSKAVINYQNALFPDLSTPAQLDTLGNRFSFIKRVATQRPTSYQFIYVQNDDDDFHIQNHLHPLARQLGMKPDTSRSADGNVQFIVEHFASGHNMPYREVLNDFVDYAFRDWGDHLPHWPKNNRKF